MSPSDHRDSVNTCTPPLPALVPTDPQDHVVAPTRRGLLRGAAVLGVATVSFVGIRTATSEAAFAASTGCATLTPEETQGPFWVDEKLNRSDIRADSATGAVQAGVPLTLTVYLTDATGNCTPQPGAYVDIWHANAQGAYSDVSGSGNPNNVGVDWLRGYQVSDNNGAVTFTTIYPGWYVSRAIHIHFRVRTSLDSTTALNFTSQLFFDEATTQAVLADSRYKADSNQRTTNTTDGIYEASPLVPLTGNVTTGYTGAFTANLDFGDGPSTTADAPRVNASMLNAKVVRRRGRRVVKVRMTSGEVVTPRLRLVRHDDVLARRQWTWLPAKHRRTLTLAVPSTVKACPAKVQLVVADKAGNTRHQKLRVRIPAR